MARKTRHSGIEVLSDGRKRIRLRAIDPRTGRMKEVDRYFTGTMEEAIKQQQKWRDEIRCADRRAVEVPRLATYAESWIKSAALRLPKVSTARWYADQFDRYILPALGDYFLDKLARADVEAWQQALVARGLAPATVNGALDALKIVLREAVADFNLMHSPAERVKALALRKQADDDTNILSAEELGRLLAAFREVAPQHYPLAATLAMTGLRIGEATALKWADIDEAAGLVRVARAQWQGVVSTPKTGTVRKVPLVAELAAILREHRAALIAAQAPGLAEGWVFPSRIGGLHTKEVLHGPLKKALAAARIERRFTTHGFRRTFNNLARQVASEIVTRAMTGHVTPAMTEHYSHVGADEKRAAAGKVVELVLRGASKAVSGGSIGGSSGQDAGTGNQAGG